MPPIGGEDPSVRYVVGALVAGIFFGGVGATNPPLLAYLGDLSPTDDVGKLGGVYNVFGNLGQRLVH